MIVLDNKATATSGFQPNAGVDKDALDRDAPSICIESVASALGIPYVRTVKPNDHGRQLRDLFRDVLSRRELALIIVRTEFEESNQS